MKNIEFIMLAFFSLISVGIWANGTCADLCKQSYDQCNLKCFNEYRCQIKCFYGAGKKCTEGCKAHQQECLGKCKPEFARINNNRRE